LAVLAKALSLTILAVNTLIVQPMRNVFRAISRRSAPGVIVYPILIAIVLAPALSAADKRIEKGGAVFKAGMLFSTTYKIDGREVDANDGITLGVGLEMPFIKLSKLAFAIDFHDVQIYNDRQFMIDASVGLKPTIYLESSNLAFKPGFAVGFGHLAEIANINGSDYLTWKASFETMFLVTPRYSYIAEILFMGADGQNDDHEISTNPTMMLRIGVMY